MCQAIWQCHGHLARSMRNYYNLAAALNDFNSSSWHTERKYLLPRPRRFNNLRVQFLRVGWKWKRGAELSKWSDCGTLIVNVATSMAAFSIFHFPRLLCRVIASSSDGNRNRKRNQDCRFLSTLPSSSLSPPSQSQFQPQISALKDNKHVTFLAKKSGADQARPGQGTNLFAVGP